MIDSIILDNMALFFSFSFLHKEERKILLLQNMAAGKKNPNFKEFPHMGTSHTTGRAVNRLLSLYDSHTRG